VSHPHKVHTMNNTDKKKELVDKLAKIEKRWKDFGGGHGIDYARYKEERDAVTKELDKYKDKSFPILRSIKGRLFNN
jgi:diaminopimelate decarboxylase